jgi:riboflavin kinase/FMN adenylyltransferase
VRIIHAAKDLKPGRRKVCLAMGFFDGVHLGHQQIIRQTIADARQHDAVALVLTFDRHPNTVVAPVHVPPLIYSLSQKQRTIASLGADALLVLHFDRRLSRRSGGAFVRTLMRQLGSVHSVCVGADFHFGFKRSGNVALLRQLGVRLGFVVHDVAAVSLDGKAVSSTRIRQTIQAGKLDAASQMLGRPYSICGEIRRGDRLGRQLGFPTCNLDVAGLVLPPHGVYAVHASARRTTHRAVLNIGLRPTVKAAKPQLRVEAHLLDFKGDLYGEEIEITFVEKLRGERRFPSLNALRRQIARDIAKARACF